MTVYPRPALRPALGHACIALTVMSGLAGCTPTHTVDPTAVKNRSQWTLPLDEFMTQPVELANYAENLLISKCLTAAGYEWPVPWSNTDFPRSEDVNEAGLSLFTPELAAKYGYHSAPAVDAAEYAAQLEFFDYANSYNPDAAFDPTFEECATAARDDQTIPDTDAINWVSDLAIQAIDAAEQTDAVVAATARWRECLSAKVDWAVPDSPHDWPSTEVTDYIRSTNSEDSLTASAEEIEIAVADADCRESSGWSEELYNAEWDAQLPLVAANRDTLERNRAAGEAHRKELLIVVAENAPPAP